MGSKALAQLGAAADCEAITSDFLGQPVNAISALAFVLAGALLLRKRSRWIGLASIAAGIGSFLFHGPMPLGSEWAHDLSLGWLLTVIAGLGMRWERLSRIPALAVLAVVIAFWPIAADPVAVVLTVLAVAVTLRRDRSWATFGPLLLAGAGGLYGRLGATGGPLCDPTSPWQPHAVWHIAAATAVAWLVRHRAILRSSPAV